MVLVDEEGIVCAALAGGPQGSDWDAVASAAAEAVGAAYDRMTFTEKQQTSRRGKFASCTAGYSYGGGRETVGNVHISGKKNKEAMDTLMHATSIQRIVGFTSDMFNTFAHKPYMEYKKTAEELQKQHPYLCPTSLQTPFAATTFNLGPQSFSPPHTDEGNNACGWCVVTALGPFDPDKGGHLVLWNMKLIVRFPPGASILFPSALVTHSNIPIQPSEKRYSMVQYSAGALFRWRSNGFKSDKAFLSSATSAELEKREHMRRLRWKTGLDSFSRWVDVQNGNWKGQDVEKALSPSVDHLEPPTKRFKR
ncbi:hypothetical protein GGU10DRAFT_275825 [Lentinula aff. detonsa]|uniref:Uncharacterized protein n=1 Tax=Lentinula aff. detonsa TaxID=2804958 RepID=A0AA38L2Q3_9AGAR|nr:hypothetical protein GGU10DRAFT_275825 [Lentinula aff. detonsa]